jgi:hypothetical protein
VADRFFQDGAAMRRDAINMAEHAGAWDSLHSDANSRYWRLISGPIIALSEALGGEPSRAYALLSARVRDVRAEVEAGNPHVWLKHDLRLYQGYLGALQSGLLFTSAGDPAAALRDAEAGILKEAATSVTDRSDVRESAIHLIHRCDLLPLRSQVDAAAGFHEFDEVRRAIQELERAGQAQALDARDYLLLSIGGTRALRRLGAKEAALAEARDGLSGLVRRAPKDSSPVLAHAENLLRFEQALLGADVREAVQTAQRYRQLWPQSLLVWGDLVKILSASGSREDAARVLASMPDCEYRRRLERELRKNEFLD